MNRNPKLHPLLCQSFPSQILINVSTRGNSVRQRGEKFENLPEDIRVSNVSDGQDLDAGSCREYASPRDDTRSKPKVWIRGNTQLGPVLKVKFTNYLEHWN